MEKLAVNPPTKKVFSEHEMSPLLCVLIPSSVWRDVSDEGGRLSARSVAADDLRAMSTQFLHVYDALHEITRESALAP